LSVSFLIDFLFILQVKNKQQAQLIGVDKGKNSHLIIFKLTNIVITSFGKGILDSIKGRMDQEKLLDLAIALIEVKFVDRFVVMKHEEHFCF
jgi:hypothetical protein